MEYPDGIFNVNSKDKFGMVIKGVKSYPCNISTHSRRATFERGGGGGGSLSFLNLTTIYSFLFHFLF